MITQVASSEIITQQRSFFSTGKTRSLDFRIEQLKALQQAIQSQEEEIAQALYNDLKRPKLESLAAEVSLCLKEIS
ncbi:MAG: aldehyde dehydrogenase family protein, partial [Spirulinaceae cyanobacterium]